MGTESAALGLPAMRYWDRRIAKGDKLTAVVTKFLADNRVHVAEDIYQTDRVIENAPELIEALADIVGYAPRAG